MKLSKKREAWAAPRNATIKGEPLTYPAAVSERYEKALNKLIRGMRADYQRELLKLFRTHSTDSAIAMDENIGSQARILFSDLGKKWSKLFSRQSKSISENMIKGVSNHSYKNLESSLKKISGGLTIKVPEMPAGLIEIQKAAIAENVALITNISTQYQQRVEQVVYSSISTGGRGAADIYDELIRVGGMTERRAHLIATDQTKKSTSAYNLERAKSVGIKKGIWRHSSAGGEPRKKHVNFDGKEFDLNEPPAIGDKGARVMPGYEINCRCYWVPVVDFDSL